MRILIAVTIVILFVGCSSTTSTPPSDDRNTTTVGNYVVTTPRSEEEDLLQKQELSKRQAGEIERQKHEIEDARRQEYYNQRMRDYSKRTFGEDEGDSWTESDEEPRIERIPSGTARKNEVLDEERY